MAQLAYQSGRYIMTIREERVTDATEGEADNLWTRLRHRKVVQWGVAHAAGTMGLPQGVA